MNIWFLIWVFLAVFITGIFLWSMQILFRQKRSWTEFAKRNQLQILTPAVFRSPMLSGTIKNIPFRLFSEEQSTEDQRGRRFRTILQFEVGPMPVEAILATKSYHNFANGLVDLTETYIPDFPGWDTSILIKTSNIALLKLYLTEERLRTLQALLTIKTFNAFYLFDRTTGYLRLETPDPFTDLQKLERMTSKVADQVEILKVK